MVTGIRPRRTGSAASKPTSDTRTLFSRRCNISTPNGVLVPSVTRRPHVGDATVVLVPAVRKTVPGDRISRGLVFGLVIFRPAESVAVIVGPDALIVVMLNPPCRPV